MALLDIFNNNAFSLATLTDYVNRQPYKPQKIAKLGLFESKGISTTSIDVEEHQGILSLIPNTPRGGVGNQNAHQKNKLRNFRCTHLELEDTVMATEVQDLRQPGTEMMLATLESVVQGRLTEMLPKHDATLEFQRLGALKGLILDADGSTVIYNLFNEFGFTQTQQDFALGTSTTDVLGLLTSVVKGAIEDALGAEVFDGVMIYAGKTWWREFITHPKVVNAYQYFQATGQNMNPLRDDLRYEGFQFGGCIIQQYRGKVGGVQFIADSEAYAFPLGDDLGIYKTYFAPADVITGINQVGLPRYAYQIPLPGNPLKGQQVLTQSNPISLCLRPDVLIKLTTSN